MKPAQNASLKIPLQATLEKADPRLRTALILAGVLSGLLLSALDQTVVATALPTIVEDLGGFAQFAWVFTTYMLAMTTSIPIAGKLSDIYGRKVTFLAGLGFFLLASILCGFANSMNQLIAFRGIQGIGAGIIMANTFTVIGDIFPPAVRGKWQGVLGAIFAIASVVGPLVGGYLTDQLNWRWVFFVNLPIGLVSATLLWVAMPPFAGAGSRRAVDYKGAALMVAGVVPMLLAFHNAGESHHWLSPQVAGWLVVAAVMLTLFVRNERKAEEPIQPPFLFRNSIFVVSAGVVFLVAGVMFGTLMFIPLFVRVNLGFTATDAGMVLTPLMLSMVATSALGGQIISRTHRYRWLAISGLVIAAVGFFLLTRMQINPSRSALVFNLVIIGAGLGPTFPVFMISVQNAFPHHILGVVTGSIQFFRSVGGAVGTAVLGSFLSMRLQAHMSRLLAQHQDISGNWQAYMGDPLAMLNGGGLSRFTHAATGAGVSGDSLAESSLPVLREAFRLAMHEVFLLGLAMLTVSFLICFFLKEIPLRTSNELFAKSHPPTAGQGEPGAGLA